MSDRVIKIDADILAYAFRERLLGQMIAALKLRVQDLDKRSGNIPSKVVRSYLNLCDSQYSKKVTHNPFLLIHHGVVSPKSNERVINEFGVPINFGKKVIVTEPYFPLLESKEGLFAILMSALPRTISRKTISEITGYTHMQQTRFEKAVRVIAKQYNYCTFNPEFEDAVQIGTTENGEPIRQVSNTYETPLETSKSPYKHYGKTKTLIGEVNFGEGKRNCLRSQVSDKLPKFYGKGFGKQEDTRDEYFENKIASTQGRNIIAVETGNEENILSQKPVPHRVKNFKQKLGKTVYL